MSGFGHISLGPWLHQWPSWLPISTLQDLIPKAIAYEILGGWRWLCPTFCVLGAQRMLTVVWGNGRVVSPPLLTLSLSAFQLCVKFIKDTLSVEQVCEALQVRVTPVESQRVKNNMHNFGAGPDLTLLFSGGQGAGFPTHSWPSSCPASSQTTGIVPGLQGTRGPPEPGREGSSHCPEQGWPELHSARALSSSA